MSSNLQHTPQRHDERLSANPELSAVRAQPSLSQACYNMRVEMTRMNEKLPIPCERCHGSGLFAGLECEECRGKGYRLSIDGTPLPARDVRPASNNKRPNRPKRCKRRPPKRR